MAWFFMMMKKVFLLVEVEKGTAQESCISSVLGNYPQNYGNCTTPYSKYGNLTKFNMYFNFRFFSIWGGSSKNVSSDIEIKIEFSFSYIFSDYDKKDSSLCGCGGPAPGLFWEDSKKKLVTKFIM